MLICQHPVARLRADLTKAIVLQSLAVCQAEWDLAQALMRSINDDIVRLTTPIVMVVDEQEGI